MYIPETEYVYLTLNDHNTSNEMKVVSNTTTSSGQLYSILTKNENFKLPTIMNLSLALILSQKMSS